MYDFFTNRAQQKLADMHMEKYMTCTCAKPSTKIDWTKPIQVYSYHHEEWVGAKLLNTLSQGDHTRIVQTDRGIWAFNDQGYWEKDHSTIQVRNKPMQTKREWIEVEVFRTVNGKYTSRVKSAKNFPLPGPGDSLVATAPIQVEYQVD